MTALLDTLLAQVKKAINEGIVEVGGNYIRTATGQIGLPKSTFTALGWSGLVQENVTKLLNMAQQQLNAEKTPTEQPTITTTQTLIQTQTPITGLPPNVVPISSETTPTSPATFSVNSLLIAGLVLFLINEVKL